MLKSQLKQRSSFGKVSPSPWRKYTTVSPQVEPSELRDSKKMKKRPIKVLRELCLNKWSYDKVSKHRATASRSIGVHLLFIVDFERDSIILLIWFDICYFGQSVTLPLWSLIHKSDLVPFLPFYNYGAVLITTLLKHRSWGIIEKGGVVRTMDQVWETDLFAASNLQRLAKSLRSLWQHVYMGGLIRCKKRFFRLGETTVFWIALKIICVCFVSNADRFLGFQHFVLLL